MRWKMLGAVLQWIGQDLRTRTTNLIDRQRFEIHRQSVAGKFAKHPIQDCGQRFVAHRRLGNTWYPNEIVATCCCGSHSARHIMKGWHEWCVTTAIRHVATAAMHQVIGARVGGRSRQCGKQQEQEEWAVTQS